MNNQPFPKIDLLMEIALEWIDRAKQERLEQGATEPNSNAQRSRQSEVTCPICKHPKSLCFLTFCNS